MDKRGKKLVTSISPSASDQSYKPLLEFVLPKNVGSERSVFLKMSLFYMII